MLTEVLQRKFIKVPVKSKDKESVIAELIDLLDADGLLSDRDAALESVMAREQTRSTGIGGRIAIPHGKCDAVNQLVMAMGIARSPIDFKSIDNKPVTIIILLISPADQTGPHIQALAKISKLMLDEDFKEQLEKANNAEEVHKMLSSKENH